MIFVWTAFFRVAYIQEVFWKRAFFLVGFLHDGFSPGGFLSMRLCARFAICRVAKNRVAFFRVTSVWWFKSKIQMKVVFFYFESELADWSERVEKWMWYWMSQSSGSLRKITAKLSGPATLGLLHDLRGFTTMPVENHGMFWLIGWSLTIYCLKYPTDNNRNVLALVSPDN